MRLPTALNLYYPFNSGQDPLSTLYIHDNKIERNGIDDRYSNKNNGRLIANMK